MSRAGPFRQESALFPGVHQPFLHLHILVRIDKVQQREQASECVPEAGVGEQIAIVDGSVVRAVMYPFAVRVDLGQITWEQDRPVKAGIECAQIVEIVILHCDPAKYLVPSRSSGLGYLVQRSVAQFFEIDFRLLLANE